MGHHLGGRASPAYPASLWWGHLARGIQTTAWRACEIVLASAFLLLLLPLLLALALAISLDSAGWPLYVATRLGLEGRSFRMFKLRTMRSRCCPLPSKLPDDPRVTRMGRMLRRASLDEIPQLLNVINGSMALVGPRPETPDNLERYHPGDYERFSVRPGLTGLWQVSGRSELSLEEKIRLDLDYARRRSLRLDLWILFRTPGVVISGRGAY